MKKVVLIAGTGHCGSTLLDLILSSHSGAFGVGELNAFRRFDKNVLDQSPGRTILDQEQKFWTPHLVDYICSQFAAEQTTPWRLLHRLAPSLNSNRCKIYESLFASLPDASMLVDSSKAAYDITRNVAQLRKKYAVYLLWIKRDPRGVINSYRRKYQFDDVLGRLIHRHRQDLAGIAAAYDRYDIPKTSVQYEMLASAPATEVRRICDFLEIDYEASMLDFWRFDHYHFGGNSGTKLLVAKFRGQGQELIEKGISHGYYHSHGLGIKLDERWKEQLSTQEQTQIVRQFGLTDDRRTL